MGGAAADAPTRARDPGLRERWMISKPKCSRGCQTGKLAAAGGSGAAAASSSTPPGYATGLATGAPSAPAPPVSVDTTGDGRVSAVAYDTTGDGRHDTIAQQHGSDGPTTRAGAATAYSAAETQTTRESRQTTVAESTDKERVIN